MSARHGGPATAAIEPRPAIGGALVGLSLAVLLPSLGTSIAGVGLPRMAESFGASFQDVQWIVLAYLLATTTLIVGAGRLGDILGRRRLLLAAIVTFTTASVLCGVAPALGLLIAARALQGVGAAGMLALTMAFVAQTVPKARIGSAMGLLGTMSAVGTALGPTLGGVLIAGFDWQAIFLISVPLGLLTLFLVYRFLPADSRDTKAGTTGFDYVGTVLLALTLGAFALAMTGTTGPLKLTLVLAAVAGLTLFVLVEARVASPVIRLGMFRDPVLGAGLFAGALVSTVMMTTLVVGPFYLALALGLDPAPVGVVMSIGPLVAVVIGAPAGRAVDRFGATRTVLVGLIGVLAGAIGLSSMSPHWGVAGYVVPLAVITAGYALFQAANNTAVMSNVRADHRGVVSGMLNLSRNLGLVAGASAMGAVFAGASGATEITLASPEDIATGTRWAFAVAAALIVVGSAVAIGTRALGDGRPRAGRSGHRGVQHQDDVQFYVRQEVPVRTMTYSESRARYAETLNAVVDDREEVVITRAGHDPVVMVALDDYESLKETAYLLRSPENARRLLGAIDRLESGSGRPHELVEDTDPSRAP